MNIRSIGGMLLLLVFLVGGLFLFSTFQSPQALTSEQAIDLVIAQNPPLADYKTTSLPPSSIETLATADGWDLSFIQRGSGLPGILNAHCYHVTSAKVVTKNGDFIRSGNTVVNAISFATCEPLPGQTVKTDTHPYGTLTLSMGEKAKFPDITIQPTGLVEDSRCPNDVQCIQAGTVRVRLDVVSGMGTSTSIVKLGTAFTTEGESITLTDVLPDKNSKTQITIGDYRLTFRVVKQGTATPNNPTGKCYVGGCSSQLCTDQPDVLSTCEYTAAYGCYKDQICERQASGECGWTLSTAAKACLANAGNASTDMPQ